MVASVSDLLHEAAEVQRLFDELLALPEPLNEDQRQTIEKIIQIVELFTSEAAEIEASLGSGNREHLSNVLYEFRPLLYIPAFCELLLIGEYGLLTDLQRTYVESAQEHARNLLALVYDLVDTIKSLLDN